MNFSQEPNGKSSRGHHGDRFFTRFSDRSREARGPGINHQPEAVRVVGNLPYFITSDILLRLSNSGSISKPSCPGAARGGGTSWRPRRDRSEYGLLSPLPQLYAGWRNVHPSARRPSRPRLTVDVTVVRLRMRQRLIVACARSCVLSAFQTFWAEAEDFVNN